MDTIFYVVVDFGFTTLLTSQVISVVFYSEREKSHKCCSEALISAWGSFTCHKSTTRDPQLYFPSEGSRTLDFYALKNPSTPAGFEPANLGSSGEYDNHGTTGVNNTIFYVYCTVGLFVIISLSQLMDIIFFYTYNLKITAFMTTVVLL